MDAALEVRLTRMEQEIAELRRENQSLRAVPEAKQDPREGELLPRRALLTGAAYTLGAVGLSLIGTRPAEAALAIMYVANTNDGFNSATALTSTNYAHTLWLDNRGEGVALNVYASNGVAVQARADGSGHAVLATKEHWSAIACSRRTTILSAVMAQSPV